MHAYIHTYTYGRDRDNNDVMYTQDGTATASGHGNACCKGARKTRATGVHARRQQHIWSAAARFRVGHVGRRLQQAALGTALLCSICRMLAGAALNRGAAAGKQFTFYET